MFENAVKAGEFDAANWTQNGQIWDIPERHEFALSSSSVTFSLFFYFKLSIVLGKKLVKTLRLI